METAASVGPYRLCSPASQTAWKAATVSGGSASPMTKTSRSESSSPRRACAANTASIEGTKSVSVTWSAAIVSAR
ncbi:Uncharacterised protein [Mycobacteroides abscessus subsp. abscessus]|nr:Uncharacterised protein [Mycobacteroides abscessus subsp. abscessus]